MNEHSRTSCLVWQHKVQNTRPKFTQHLLYYHRYKYSRKWQQTSIRAHLHWCSLLLLCYALSPPERDNHKYQAHALSCAWFHSLPSCQSQWWPPHTCCPSDTHRWRGHDQGSCTDCVAGCCVLLGGEGLGRTRELSHMTVMCISCDQYQFLTDNVHTVHTHTLSCTHTCVHTHTHTHMNMLWGAAHWSTH